ncbi:hypothetical protein HN51_017464 [Arachis hypogaea]
MNQIQLAKLPYHQPVIRAPTRTARNFFPLPFYINPHSSRIFPSFPAKSQTLHHQQIQQQEEAPMAFSKAMILTALSMLVIAAVVSVATAAEAPAPSPTSPATAVSPSFAAVFVAAVAALAFGSGLRI